VRLGTAAALALLSLPLLSLSADAASGLDPIDGVRPTTLEVHEDGSGSGDDIYQSSKEEKDAPSTWAGTTGVLDQGSDLTRIYEQNEIDDTGDTWLYLGFERGTVGNTAAVVELNQLADVQSTAKGNRVPLQVPQRSAGDLRITFTQPTGGADLAPFKVNRWTGTAWGPEKQIGESAGLFDSAVSPDNLFAEFAINLSGVGLMNGCDEGFTQVNIRTRSSSLDTASLKDYITPLDVNIENSCRSIRVEKYDATAGDAPLSGADFILYADDGDGVFEPNQDDVVGNGPETANQGDDHNTYTWGGLHWGTYWVQESTPPRGYEQDPDADANGVKKVTVGRETEVGVVAFHNPQTMAKIRVEKYDDAGSPLPGATFQLYADNNGNETLDAGDDPLGGPADASEGAAGNTYTWDDPLPYGRYLVEETGRPEGYDVDPSSDDGVKAVRLTAADAGDVVPVQFHNPAYTPSITVSKYDEGDTPLTGATFQLYADTNDDGVFDAGDLAVGTSVVADGGGQSNSYTWTEGLDWGTYFVQETQAPVGYDVDPSATTTPGTSPVYAAKTVTISATAAGHDGAVNFHDPKLPVFLTVVKQDTDYQPLQGASFTLYHDDNGAPGDPIGTEHAAIEGPGKNTYTWKEPLDWSKSYLVCETTLPSGYGTATNADADGCRDVVLDQDDAGTTQTREFYDPPITDGQANGSIEVTKIGAGLPTNDNRLDGAVFELYKDADTDGAADAEELLDWAPDHTAVGTWQWDGLDDGTYFVKEVQAPQGYLLHSEESQPGSDLERVDITAGSRQESVTFVNQPKKSTIVLTKTDADTGEQVDGGRFELLQGDAVSGIQPVHVPGTGVYTWAGLRVGDYTVREVAPPAGYLAPNKDELSGTGEETVSITTANAGETIPVSMQNEQMLSTIVVRKIDVDTKQELDGATFELIKDNVILDKEPEHDAGTGVYTWSDLPMGVYTVAEVEAPEGYLPPSQDNLPEDGIVSITIDGHNAGIEKTFTFRNQQRKNTITVHKYDASTNELINGALFTVYRDVNHNDVLDDDDKALIGPDEAPDEAGTGTYRWDNLLAGDYLVKEALAPVGYLPPADSVQSVELADGDNVTVDFYNMPTPKDQNPGGDTGGNSGGTTDPGTPDPGTANLVVTKRDATTERAVDTAGFQLWQDADGNGTWDENADETVGAEEQTEDGQVTWTDLEPGTYFVQETKAPKGYDFPASPVKKVVVDAGNVGTTVERTFDDPQKQTTIELVKQDDETGEALAGAIFQAYRDVDGSGTVTPADARVGDPRVSNLDGMVVWSRLGFGRYLVEEVAAPEGYGLADNAVQSVVVDRSNAGGVLRMVFLDPAQGALRITKTAWERDADGAWVPSDGTVRYGDRVRYVVTAVATGPRVYRDVQVTDYVPGYAPDDTASTAKAAYVEESATCGLGDCATSYDPISRELSWSFGNLRDTKRTAEFVVRMPQMPMHPTTTDDGVYTDTVVNVAEATWLQRPRSLDSAARTSAARTEASVRSNEVVTKVSGKAEILGLEPTGGSPGWHTPSNGLPNTGAPDHTGLFTTVGALSVLLGAWLMLAGRRRGRLLLQR
jgi:LPXTG-motif cell wall-anchored protein